MSENYVNDLMNFIDNSPTAFHATANITNILDDAGYSELLEESTWDVKRTGKYYVKRNDSSIIAFEVPSGEVLGLKITAAHSDSPCFKLKTNPEKITEGAYISLNTEKYGGSIMPTWLDRPLGIAGRVVIKENNEIKSILVDLEDDVAIIPNLAIHMNPDINKGKNYDAQVDMLPIIGSENAKDALMEKIAITAGVHEADVLASDLLLYNNEESRIVGLNKEYICAPRLDDLQCAYGLIQGLTSSPTSENMIKICAIFDNEEVGSSTRQGADSTFLCDVIDRILSTLKLTDKKHEILASSILISADNAHAVHPNHPEASDPSNKPLMNKGIVIKHNANQKYTTDAVTEGYFVSLCKEADVPYQHYCNKSTIAGGSTLGNISISHLSIPSIDIGLPQLAMHSAYETAGVKDVEYLITVINKFYE